MTAGDWTFYTAAVMHTACVPTGRPVDAEIESCFQADHRMTQRIRVLFVIGTMSGGGAERQVVEILRLIDRTRFEPLLCLATRSGELLDQVPPDVPIFAFQDSTAESWWRRLARRCKLSPLLRYVHLARVLRRERIDIVYDRTCRATLDAAGATWIRPTPRVSCCVAQPELEFGADWRGAFRRRFARAAYRRASLVVANSDGLRERVIEYYGLPPEHVVTVGNLIDLEDLDRRANDTSVDIPAVPFLLVTAGRLHPEKGFRYLLEAIDLLVHDRQCSLLLVILGTGPQEAELREFIQSRKLQNHVRLGGFVANALPWFRRANLFVLSSLNEGLPNSLLEAVACGTPAVSTDCLNGPREILEQGKLGELVPPGDSMALANAIQSAMDHYPDWQQRAIMARESVRHRYDARAGILQLQELLTTVLRNAGL